MLDLALHGGFDQSVGTDLKPVALGLQCAHQILAPAHQSLQLAQPLGRRLPELETLRALQVAGDKGRIGAISLHTAALAAPVVLDASRVKLSGEVASGMQMP